MRESDHHCQRQAPAIDPTYADLLSIAIVLADDNKHSVTRVAKSVFRHERHAQRVKNAVPLDWIEVDTQFGVRHLRRTMDGERQYIRMRHAAKRSALHSSGSL